MIIIINVKINLNNVNKLIVKPKKANFNLNMPPALIIKLKIKTAIS